MNVVHRFRQADHKRALFAGAIVTSAILTGGILLVLAAAAYIVLAK
jgi:hypothetical protein